MNKTRQKKHTRKNRPTKKRKKLQRRPSKLKKKTHHRTKKQPKKKLVLPFWGEIKLFALVLSGILLLFMGGTTLFYSVKQVSGYGMMPSLRNKDVLVVQRRSELNRFDMVLLNNGLEEGFRRIIGLPGEKIRYQDDTLLIDEQPVDEKFIVDKINEYQAKGKNFTANVTLGEIVTEAKIPDGHYLVLGDNRPYTTDSRDYGLIKKSEIAGKVVLRIFPLEAAERF